MFTNKLFWRETLDRALKSGFQAVILIAGSDVLNLWDVDYGKAAGLIGGAIVLSVATSVAAGPVGSTKDSPQVL